MLQAFAKSQGIAPNSLIPQYKGWYSYELTPDNDLYVAQIQLISGDYKWRIWNIEWRTHNKFLDFKNKWEENKSFKKQMRKILI